MFTTGNVLNVAGRGAGGQVLETGQGPVNFDRKIRDFNTGAAFVGPLGRQQDRGRFDDLGAVNRFGLERV
jgi:hypothetical protein